MKLKFNGAKFLGLSLLIGTFNDSLNIYSSIYQTIAVAIGTILISFELKD